MWRWRETEKIIWTDCVRNEKVSHRVREEGYILETISLVNTQNVSVTKIVDFSSIQCAESKNGLRIQFVALVVMIHEVWHNA